MTVHLFAAALLRLRPALARLSMRALVMRGVSIAGAAKLCQPLGF
jgi:hypothetical protein